MSTVNVKISDITLFEQDDFIVVNKPAGLLSIPDREGKENSLKKLLAEKFGGIYTVHRLDKGTSGVIVFAKTEIGHQTLSLLFEQRQTDKIYLGLVSGTLSEKKGTIDAAIMEHPVKRGLMVVNRKGKEALTEYAVLDEFGIYSWLRFQIFTGRTHQIRVHMKDIGHPIVCDEVYGDGQPIFVSAIKHRFKLSKQQEEERPILQRLALHSAQLSFTWSDGKEYAFEAPLPKDLSATLQQLSKRKKTTR